MRCVDLVVAAGDCASAIVAVTVTADITHAWVGDLTMKLVHPDTTVVTLMSLPGFAESADDGESSSGPGANLAAGYPITFATGAPTSAEAIGSTLNNTQDVCREDLRCSYAPNAGAAGGPNLTGLNGKSATGTWKFCVGDSGTRDTGRINQVTLTITR